MHLKKIVQLLCVGWALEGKDVNCEISNTVSNVQEELCRKTRLGL